MIEGLNSATIRIEDSLSTDTTELTNVKHKKQSRTDLTNFTVDPERIGKKKPRSKISNTRDIRAPQETGENN